MADAKQPVCADAPLMVAWTAYSATDEFANTKRWATKPDHTVGSLWAAFAAGFAAARTEALATQEGHSSSGGEAIGWFCDGGAHEVLTFEPEKYREKGYECRPVYLQAPATQAGDVSSNPEKANTSDGHVKAGDVEALRAALPADPQGFVLVPREPTEAMIAEALKVDFDNEDERATVINIWNSMSVAASPKAGGEANG